MTDGNRLVQPSEARQTVRRTAQRASEAQSNPHARWCGGSRFNSCSCPIRTAVCEEQPEFAGDLYIGGPVGLALASIHTSKGIYVQPERVPSSGGCDVAEGFSKQGNQNDTWTLRGGRFLHRAGFFLSLVCSQQSPGGVPGVLEGASFQRIVASEFSIYGSISRAG